MTATFQIVTEFSAYADASGAQMVARHPACGTMALSYVNNQIKTHGIAPAKCFGNRARGQFNWALNAMKADFSARVQALGSEWHNAHVALYAEEEAA